MKYLIVFFLLLSSSCGRMNIFSESSQKCINYDDHCSNRLKTVPRSSLSEMSNVQDQCKKLYELLLQFVQLLTNGSERMKNVWDEPNNSTLQRIQENHLQKFHGNASSDGFDKFNDHESTKYNTDLNDIRMKYISNLCYFGFYLLFRCV